MNDELKDALRGQGERVRQSVLRYKCAKEALDVFDANTRIAALAANPKLTLDDAKARIMAEPNRAPMSKLLNEAEADKEGAEADTKCLLAHVSLVCSETAAMSRISQ